MIYITFCINCKSRFTSYSIESHGSSRRVTGDATRFMQSSSLSPTSLKSVIKRDIRKIYGISNVD